MPKLEVLIRLSLTLPYHIDIQSILKWKGYAFSRYYAVQVNGNWFNQVHSLFPSQALKLIRLGITTL